MEANKQTPSLQAEDTVLIIPYTAVHKTTLVRIINADSALLTGLTLEVL